MRISRFTISRVRLMRWHCLLCALLWVPWAAAQTPTQSVSPRILLAGDSTVTDDAGWGTGFKSFFDCNNLAKGGRSSRSYRTEGWWSTCLAAKPDVLLIQFGHNDQPGKGPERESRADGDFRQHLRDYVTQAKAAGIQPVLITSLERRRWNQDQRIEPSLAEYAEATAAVATELSVPLIDLHKLSIDMYNRLGPTAVRAFEPMSSAGADHTHLNKEGSAVIGQLVARELVKLMPALEAIAKAPIGEERSEDAEPHSESNGLSVVETTAQLTIYQDERALLFYNKQSPPVPEGIDPIFARSGFLHPVNTPAGKTVTATFPLDHAHQHGIFSAWVRTTYDNREIDFWNLAGKTGRVLHQRVRSTFDNDSGAGFEVDLIHQTATNPIVDVLRESWRVVAYPTKGNSYVFDIETKQQALTEKPLVVQKYHYGGMALRGRVEWVQGENLPEPDGKPLRREPSDFINDLGSARTKGNHEHSRWVALHGEIEGAPVCIAVLSHVDNFRAPQAARLHPSKPYFCFAPCVDGQFVIDQEHPLLERYRYLITDTAPDPKWIDEQWQNWCGQR